MDSQDNLVKTRRKRNRRFQACTECRRKKIKCDRKNPCSRCIKSHLYCEYKTPSGVWIDETRPKNELSDGSSTATTPADIQSQLNYLKGMIETIRQGERKHTSIIIDNDYKESVSVSILDRKLSSLKQTAILYKPSRTLFLGPLSQHRILGTAPIFRFLAQGLKTTLNDERREWKRLHKGYDHNMNFLNCDVDEESVIKLVKKVICSYYYAVQERLVYFQNNLNRLLYNNFVPMGVIHSLFLSHFSISENGVVIFDRPKKCYAYADISAITGIVYLVLIFTRYNNESSKFRHQLPIEANELSLLTLSLLNLSQFRRKRTHEALLTLIFLRSGLFIHDNSEGANEEINSYPLFQMCLDYCYQMGLHYDPDTIDSCTYRDKLVMRTRMMSAQESRELWNYMQTIDAMYSTICGSPLLINYDYCMGFHKQSNFFYDKAREEATLLLRSTSKLGNSLSPISLRELLDQIKGAISFCSQIPFKIMKGGDLDEFAHLCRLKLLILQVTESLCRMVIVGISDLYHNDSLELSDRGASSALQSIVKEMNRISLLCSTVTLFHIITICEGKSTFGEEADGKYIVYFRDVFSRTMGMSSIIWFNYLFSRAVKSSELATDQQVDGLLQAYPADEEDSDTHWTGELNLNVLEHALYSSKDEEADRLCSKLVSTPVLMNFATKFYDVMCRNSVMKDSLDSFIMLKAGVLWVYALQTIEENIKELGKKQLTVTELIEITKKKVESNFNLGRLNGKLEFSPDKQQFERFFDSMFTDPEWLTTNLGNLDPNMFYGQDQNTPEYSAWSEAVNLFTPSAKRDSFK
ncbi:DEKNAAC104882 [Brettanomyces naardenensis]|uniref:DEKNAAC104882 n=1 Tax=Brettanomyces naardenensis TaxID=13370 RepID=A0A448YS61_BRENA|nr:DEKNAAC104882 [Brettanomyces naardenensis]